MSKRFASCRVIEVAADPLEAHRQPPRDLLPWADPYIARLLVQHRLECAMEDQAEAMEQLSPVVLPMNRLRNESSRW